MQCPSCKSKTSVGVAVTLDYETVIERKRYCRACGQYFTTLEQPLVRLETLGTQLALFGALPTEEEATS